MMQTILSLLDLSPEQAAAALSPHTAVAVTAGAGSGKTRTLAGRYLWLLEQGHPVRSLIAVTFTEKAAREMRNRIRGYISAWRNQIKDGDSRALWDRAFAELDAARIGTIHSLCAAILRAHPAEAVIDPLFEVLEENTATLLQARAVEQAMAWAVDDPVCAALFGPLNENRLRKTLSLLLAKRLDAQPAFLALGDDALQCWSQAAASWFATQLAAPTWRQALDDLAAIHARTPDDRMERARRDVLALWREVEEARLAGIWEQVVTGLARMRKANSHQGLKGNWAGDDLDIARQAMRTLRTHYDENLKPLLGGKKLPSWTLDERAAALQPALRRLFQRCLDEYEGMKSERHALDFDDLESMTVTLLAGHPPVRERWQTATAAVLVDEFQDTNARQREIIYRLTHFEPGAPLQDAPPAATRLFIVGDGKQSIYRFRGADVTIFRETQAAIAKAQGRTVNLDTTYRAHQPLVQTLNRLLAPIMGEEDDPERRYHTPFAPLRAHRLHPRPHIRPPFLEFHLGLGENADERRAAATAGLARRLRQLHDEGSRWGDMALLFRASRSFEAYEDALEAAGIPFVTVAGRGFYERPEIRDLLNALTAIADPSDDLALAGLLRSPMFGLSDAGLFLLRWGAEPGRGRLGFWEAIHDDGVLATLDAVDARQARRAREIVAALHDMAGRHTVAFILNQLLDRTRYRAALRLAATGERAWRNVDKLLADAHRSRLVGIPEFLEYVHSLRDVDAREGEAVAEIGDTVQLMTIHKAKGLEFPIVVLADACYEGSRYSAPLLLDKALGLLMAISDPENTACPLSYRLGLLHEKDRDEAEAKRLLYVAATRAQEKFLVSAHCEVSKAKKNAGMLKLKGWLGWLGAVVGLDGKQVESIPPAPVTKMLAWGNSGASLTLYPPSVYVQTASIPAAPPVELPSPPTDFIAPLLAYRSPEQPDEKVLAREADPPSRVWRISSTSSSPPNWVVGALVHQALQHWRFPGQPGFDAFLRTFALESGLTSPPEIRAALREVRGLLERFRRHALFAELDRSERRHEAPYSVEIENEIDSGVVDLLARSDASAPWTVYDFKTDQLRADVDLQVYARAKGYDDQIERYARALTHLLGRRPATALVFLNVGGSIKLIEEGP